MPDGRLTTTYDREAMMPLPGARYRMVPLKGGGYERLAFRGNSVVETKNMKTGKTHTEGEFAADEKHEKKEGQKKALRGKH